MCNCDKKSFPRRKFKKQVVALALGGMRLATLAQALKLPLKELEQWRRKLGKEIKPGKLPERQVKRQLALVKAIGQRDRARAEIAKLRPQKKSAFPKPQFKKKTVALAVNGGVRLAALAEVLKLSLKDLKHWKRDYQGKIKRRKLSAKAVEQRLAALQAVSSRARRKA